MSSLRRCLSRPFLAEIDRTYATSPCILQIVFTTLTYILTTELTATWNCLVWWSLIPLFHVWLLTAFKPHPSLVLPTPGQADKKGFVVVRGSDHKSLYLCRGTLIPSLPTNHHKNSKPISFPNVLNPFQTSLGGLPYSPQKALLVWHQFQHPKQL